MDAVAIRCKENVFLLPFLRILFSNLYFLRANLEEDAEVRTAVLVIFNRDKKDRHKRQKKLERHLVTANQHPMFFFLI